MGRPETKPWRTFTCRVCGAKRQTKRDRQVVCNQRCMLARLRESRWKLPRHAATRRALLMRLYWKERKTSIEIAKQLDMSHKGVLGAMRMLKITRRGMGPRAEPHCIEKGCNRPIYKILHKANGSWYGRRCYLHWVVYRFSVNQPKEGSYASWQRRNRRLLSRAKKLAHALSSTLSAESKPELTSRTSCRR